MKNSQATRFDFTADETDKEITAGEILTELQAGKSVYIAGATITGPFTLSYQTIKGEFVLRQCVVSDIFDARNATFERQVELNGTTFAGGVVFFGTTFRCFLDMKDAAFEGVANFTLANMAQGGNLTKARFLAGLILTGAKADFLHMVEAVVKGNLDCRQLEVTKNLEAAGLQYDGPQAFFTALSVHGDAILTGAVFNGPTELSQMKLKGSLYLLKVQFLAASTGADPVNSFFGSVIKGSMGLSEAVFKGRSTFELLVVQGNFIAAGLCCEQPVVFNRMKLDGTIDLRKAQFLAASTGDDQGNSFFGSVVRGEMWLSEALFKGRSTFESLIVHGNFNAANLRCEGPVNFSRMRLKGMFNAQSAKFLGVGTKDVAVNSFAGCAIEGDAILSDTVFMGMTSFESLAVQGNMLAKALRCEGPTIFNYTKLDGILDLREARFLAAAIGDTPANSFFGSVVKGGLLLAGAVFKGKTTFEAFTVQGNIAAPGVIFVSPVNVTRMHVKGQLNLTGAKFLGAPCKDEYGSSFESSVIENGVVLTETVFKGKTTFQALAVQGDISAIGVRFNGWAVFNSLKLDGTLNLSKAQFLAASMGSEHINSFFGSGVKGSLVLTEAVFKGRTTFEALVVQGNFAAQSVTFEVPTNAILMTVGGELNLINAKFLCDDAKDQGNISFFGSAIGRELLLTDASFQRGVSFESVAVQGNFNAKGISFAGSTNFSNMKMQGELMLEDAKFLWTSFDERGVEKTANNFYRSEIGGLVCLFGARFVGQTSFRAMNVHGAMEVSFVDHSQKETEQKPTYFDSRVDFSEASFHGPFDLVGGEVKGEAVFAGAHFLDRAHFATTFGDAERNNPDSEDEVIFNRARFDGPVIFDSLFLGGMWTFGARFEDFVKFRGGCRIKKLADWRETRFAGIHFMEDLGRQLVPQPFDGQVDWRGCHYAVLQHDEEVKSLWPILRDKWCQQLGQRLQTRRPGNEIDIYRFDARPYEQMEKVCRGQGLDGLADEVFYEKRCRASEYEKTQIIELLKKLLKGEECGWKWWGTFVQQSIFFTWDYLERVLFGWGVKPGRMFAGFAIFCVIGAGVFSLDGTLESSSKAQTALESIYSASLVSVSNLVPGLGELKTLGVEPAWKNWLAAICTVLQHLFGWMLLALLAKRFFAGLSRAGNDSNDD